jgi:hypothetical protein
VKQGKNVHWDKFSVYLVLTFNSYKSLFSLIEHYAPNFNRFNNKQKLELILKGVNIDNSEFFQTNVTLTLAVQNVILLTKGFTAMENEI